MAVLKKIGEFLNGGFAVGGMTLKVWYVVVGALALIVLLGILAGVLGKKRISKGESAKMEEILRTSAGFEGKMPQLYLAEPRILPMTGVPNPEHYAEPLTVGADTVGGRIDIDALLSDRQPEETLAPENEAPVAEETEVLEACETSADTIVEAAAEMPAETTEKNDGESVQSAAPSAEETVNNGAAVAETSPAEVAEPVTEQAEAIQSVEAVDASEAVAASGVAEQVLAHLTETPQPQQTERITPQQPAAEAKTASPSERLRAAAQGTGTYTVWRAGRIQPRPQQSQPAAVPRRPVTSVPRPAPAAKNVPRPVAQQYARPAQTAPAGTAQRTVSATAAAPKKPLVAIVKPVKGKKPLVVDGNAVGKTTVIKLTEAPLNPKNGRFIIMEDKGSVARPYRLALLSGIGELIFASEGYKIRPRIRQVETLRKTLTMGYFTYDRDKKGNFRLRLFTADNKLFGVGDICDTLDEAEQNAKQVKKYAFTATYIEDPTVSE